MPRDREASFERQIVAKRQRRVGGIDDQVIPLVAEGLTTNEVQAHLAGFYDMDVSRETIATLTGCCRPWSTGGPGLRSFSQDDP